MYSYGVSLDWEDLRHLVLSDKEAVDAALGVAAYLKRHTLVPPLGMGGLFTLRDGGAATFRMASAFAASDAGMATVQKAEAKAAVAREGRHWEEVQAKQRQVCANALICPLSPRGGL